LKYDEAKAVPDNMEYDDERMVEDLLMPTSSNSCNPPSSNFITADPFYLAQMRQQSDAAAKVYLDLSSTAAQSPSPFYIPVQQQQAQMQLGNMSTNGQPHGLHAETRMLAAYQ
jgi:hypothetical protein